MYIENIKHALIDMHFLVHVFTTSTYAHHLGGYGIVPPVCRSSSSEQQHQGDHNNHNDLVKACSIYIGSKLVFGNSVERRMIEKPHPQNHTAIQEEVQHGTYL